LVDSWSDCNAGSDRDVDLPLADGSVREVGCGLESESKVESGSEEEKAVGVAEGCLGVEEGCLGRKACSTSLHVDEDESVLE
jgi:hypothetical protein